MLDPTLISAIVYSCLITLITIGFTLGYLTAKVPNFAHGTIAGIGAYVAFTWYVWGYSPYLAAPIAFVLTALVCLAVYRFILSPLAHLGATTVSLMISTIAIEMIVLAFLNIYADYLQFHVYVASRFFILRSVDFQVMGIPGILIVSICAAVMCIVLLHTMLTKTRFGISMRATVESPDLASTMGVNVELVTSISWFLTGGLAGLAGCLFSLWFQVDPNTGSRLILTVFAASVLGGLTSIYGAIVGGFAMALAEVYVTSVLAGILGAWVIPYGLLIPLVVMSMVLLTFPRGIVELISGVYRERLISQYRKNRG
jgi:branched-chain amino acid transport system permease protein